MDVSAVLLTSLSPYLPRVRDLCVEQKTIATVSAGVKVELFLQNKRVLITSDSKNLLKTASIKNIILRIHIHVHITWISLVIEIIPSMNEH